MAANSTESWCTIESDPGVFTELIEKIGVEGVLVEELYTLCEEELKQISPIYGLIFLFKYRSEKDERPIDVNADVFFASQVINNACATQAILSILMNNEDIELGNELSTFREFTKDFPPELKGLAISNSMVIRQVHNSFARPEPIVMEGRREATGDDDLFHFISYVPRGGILYELDGLKGGPIRLGECSKDGWALTAMPHIQERIARYQSSEIRFNLLAMTKDKELSLHEELATVEAQLWGKAMRVDTKGGKPVVEQEGTKDAMDDSSNEEALRARVEVIKAGIAEEKRRKAAWKLENLRRRHDYLPFLVNLLKLAAQKGAMTSLEQAGEVAKEEKE